MSIDRVIHDMKGYEFVTMQFEGELRAINRLADGVSEGVIVAIGSFRGQTDCALALHAHVPVYCIDPRQSWEGEAAQFGDTDRDYWMQNVMSLGLASKVRPIELSSLEVAKIWNKPIGFLFVDGCHPEVAADLDAWMPFVIEGGLVATHDSNSPMIIAAVTARTDLVEIERSDITAIYRKEDLYELFEFDGLDVLVRRGPYNRDDKYVWGEVRSYDIGSEPVRTCIDVGAHIGAFSAWVRKLWPEAQVVAVEPEISNYRLLTTNLSTMGSDYIWCKPGRVNYDGGGLGLFVDPINSGCHRVTGEFVPGASVIPAPEPITLESLMHLQGWETLDLLKLDCEGSEVDILTNCTDDLLRHTRRIVGEFHAGPEAFLTGIGERLQQLGFAITAETNPAAHATFLAVNLEWSEPPILPEEPHELDLPFKAPPPPTAPLVKKSRKKRLG